ncbi:MAG: phosphoribosyltransferase family protein [Candidatus Liptonbacteria bacterium]|nr:phosphoribosyltransferase family protein [Candidatus Liptonbacteria bacterium]
MINEQDVWELLKRAGAILNGHFVYVSGKHGLEYINKYALYARVPATALLCLQIANQFANDEVDVVAGPAMGGVILSQWTAYYLARICDREVRAVFADKAGDDFVFGRGYDEFIPGKNVLVVQDVLTTGGDAKKTIEAVRDLGGNVVGLGALCNRGGVLSADVANPQKFAVLTAANMVSYDEKECPLCVQGVPINTDVGHGREFLARRE